MNKAANTTNIIGVKELRQNLDKYARAVARGQTFMVVKRSKPVFTIQKPQVIDEFGDPAGHWTDSLDLRDKHGNGMPLEDFVAILRKVDEEDEQRERQNPKVSGQTNS